MFKKPQRAEYLALSPDEAIEEFPPADVLFALEWSVVAPGIGGWDVLIDDERHTRLVSVVPPGANAACFFIYFKGSDVIVMWLAANGKGDTMEVGRFSSLRSAVLALCPLNAEQRLVVSMSLEVLCPRTLRSR